MTTVRPIRCDEDLDAALKQIDLLWDAEEGTEAADQLEILSILVENYEKTHHTILPPDPIEAIKFRIEQQGLDRKTVGELFGSVSKASEVLNGYRKLSLAMIRRIHARLDVSMEVLVGEIEVKKKSPTTSKPGGTLVAGSPVGAERIRRSGSKKSEATRRRASAST